MISNANSEISPANNQIYNSQEIANLYEDFFRIYSEDASESKEESKQKFSEICKAFKAKCDSEKQVSLHLVLIEVEKNHEFAEFMINNLKILFSQDLDSKKLSDIFGTSRIIEEIIPPESLKPEFHDNYKYIVNYQNEDRIENFIRKVKSESSTEQSSTPATYEENKKELLSIIDTTNPDSKKNFQNL